MPGFSIKLKGFDEVLKKLDPEKMQQDITAELVVFGQQVVLDAKLNVEENLTTDRGGLINSIGSVSTAPLSVEIFANIEYAAFIEFGTRRFAAAYVAALPPDWKTFAAQFKGSGGGGSFSDLVLRIKEWAERTHKADPAAAYVIARKILIQGSPAQPYLFPAVEKNRPGLIKNLQNLFK